MFLVTYKSYFLLLTVFLIQSRTCRSVETVAGGVAAHNDAAGGKNEAEVQPPLPQGGDDQSAPREARKAIDGNMQGAHQDELVKQQAATENSKHSVDGKLKADDSKSDNPDGRNSKQGNAGFMHAFIATLSVIVVSELGDKTFFIAAIMAMRHSRLIVFAGAMSALALMHVMSALFGTLATLIPRKFTFYLSSGLFVIFGLKMLREGWNMSPDEGKEEYEETQAELKKYEDDQLQAKSAVTQDPETGIVRAADTRFKLLVCVSPLFIQAATLNFLAEWGDRSQIAAIVLAARENLLGVIIGGLIGHFLCTGLAVIGGRAIAQRLSVRTVTLLGGVVFLLFAVSAFFIDPTAS